MSGRPPADTARGGTNVLILRALAIQPMHWLGITPPHRAGASGTMLVRPGSLAPAVHRMEEAGWLSAEWGESENRRHTRFYRLTAAGKRQLEEKSDRWAGIAASDQMACALRRIR